MEETQVHLAVVVKAIARQLDEPCDSLAIPQKMKKMRTKIYGCHHFEMPNVMQATYFGSQSPCRYLTFIWHFEMLMKCNANISIPGAM